MDNFKRYKELLKIKFQLEELKQLKKEKCISKPEYKLLLSQLLNECKQITEDNKSIKISEQLNINLINF